MEWIGKLLSVHTGDTWYVGKEFFDMNEKEQKEIKAEEERIRENGQATLEENGKRIHLLSIIGEIEGHENLSGSTKTTKYEHILPELAKVESDETIGGVLILVNTIGGDVSCGLALADDRLLKQTDGVSCHRGQPFDRSSACSGIGLLFYCADRNDAGASGAHERDGDRNGTDV